MPSPESGLLNHRKLAVFLQSADPERVASAMSLIAAAATLDWDVVVVFLGPAFRSHMEDRLDEQAPDPESTPSRLLSSAVAFGRVTRLACSAEARRAGYPEETMRARLDEIVAMSTILRRVRSAGTKLFI